MFTLRETNDFQKEHLLRVNDNLSNGELYKIITTLGGITMRKSWIILLLLFLISLFIYTFYLLSTNGEGGIPFIILMISSAVFFGSLRMLNFKTKYQ